MITMDIKSKDNVTNYVYLKDHCRLCMSENVVMANIVDCKNKNYIDEIFYCTGVKVSRDDCLPKMVCVTCLKNLSIAHSFKTKCVSTDEYFQNYLKNVKIEGEQQIEVKIESEPQTGVKIEMSDDDDDHWNGGVQSDDEFLSMKKIEKKLKAEKKNILKNNKNTHTCTICEKEFETNVLLQCHKRNEHPSPSVCEICGMQYSNKISYYAHKRIHLPKKFECGQCDYKTYYSGDLVKHIRVHTGELKYQCESCTCQFRSTSNLRRHIRVHHTKDDGCRKKFPCNRCPAKFTVKSHLKRHLDTHDSIKRYTCDVCHSNFSRLSHKKRHMLKQHSIVLPRVRPGKQVVHSNDIIIKNNVTENRTPDNQPVVTKSEA